MSGDEDIESIRTSLGLDARAEAEVHRAGDRLLGEIEGWVERFYVRLIGDPVAMRILVDEGRVVRLKRTLAAWFAEIFALPFDGAYQRAREQIGRTHVRIGMPQHLMVTAMNGIRRDVAESVARVWRADAPGARRAVEAVEKALDLELALMLAAYRRHSRDDASDPGVPRDALAGGRPRGAETLAAAAPAGSPFDPAALPLRGLAGLEQMSATLAHELRNPVAAFAGALDLLSQDLAPSDRAEVAALARGRIDEMRLLLDDTLRLARPLKGPPGPVECALVVRSAVAGVGTDPLFANVDLRVRIADESIQVLGYEQPLQQVVTNLLVNAAQAQAGRGVVDVSLVREGSRAALRVADEGPGIPENLREKVFEPFWTTKKSGTGLGLAYVRRVVEACGGSARVEDGPARGASLLLDLPLAPPPAPR